VGLGQNRNSGEIRGTVTDASSAVVPGAKIIITNTLTGVVTNLKTNDAGVYAAASLEPGEYSLTFVKEGFKKSTHGSVTLHVEALTIDASLEIGTSSQEVVVQASSSAVQTETSDKRSLLSGQTVKELPLVSRSWYDLTKLLPGVAPGANGGETNGQEVSINGGITNTSSWLVDGGYATYPVSQNPDLLQVPLEAIAEVNVVLNNFNAEYGNGSSSFNVITKGGTNRFHGSLFEYVQNDAFEARNFFAESKPPLRWNQWGGTVGGPIKKNKLFFFYSFQRNPQNTSGPGFATFPTQAMRQGDFSGLPTVYDPNSLTQGPDGTWTRTALPGNQAPANSIDPVAAAIQKFWPNPTAPGVYNNYYYTLASPQNTMYNSGKVDYNMSEGNRITGSWMRVDFTQPSNTPTYPIGANNTTYLEQTGQLSDVWTISPTIVNEARFSFVGDHAAWIGGDYGKGYPGQIGLKNAQADVFPTISVGGVGAPTSLSTGLNALLGFYTFDFSDALTVVRGRHILKFGGEFNKWRDNQAWANLQAGNFDFSGLFSRNPSDPTSTGVGYADFYFGLPDNWNVSTGSETGGRVWNTQAFAQDDFKVTSKLTLNFGLRWLVQSGWTEVHNRVASFDPTLTNPATNTLGAMWFGGQNGRSAIQETKPALFEPRLGFAWAPKERWSIRGGWGIFHLPWGGNSYTSGLGTGWTISGNESATDQLHPIFTMQQGPPLPLVPTAANRTPEMLNGQGVSYFPYDTPAAYVQQWHLSVQHELGAGFIVEAAYVGNRGSNLGFGTDFNQVPISKVGPGDMQPNRPYPQYQGISDSSYVGWSNYNALQVNMKKDLARSFYITANYTYSKSTDTGTGAGWGGYTSTDAWQDASDVGANHGPSSNDIRNLFNGSIVYQLPVGRGKALLNRGGIADAILGGWQLSTTFSLHGGMPFTPLMGTVNLDGTLAGNWRPNRIGSGTVSNPTIQQWFDPSAFVQPAPYTFGDSGRHILYGPDYKNVNLSLAKSWKLPFIGEQGSLQLRGDASNAFNHTNFNQPDASIGTSGVGIISSAYPSRNLQIGAKISF
jgi:hypothetical protein